MVKKPMKPAVAPKAVKEDVLGVVQERLMPTGRFEMMEKEGKFFVISPTGIRLSAGEDENSVQDKVRRFNQLNGL